MNILLKLLEQNVLIQSLIALLCTSAIVYLTVVGREIPEVLTNMVLFILGFYFGSKIEQGLASTISSQRRE